jgi:hypothetical protein
MARLWYASPPVSTVVMVEARAPDGTMSDAIRKAEAIHENRRYLRIL